MAAILATIELVVQSCISMVQDWVNAIVGDTTGILLLGVIALPLVGLGIGLLKRLLSANV